MNNILQWNTNGFYPRIERIQLLIKNYKPTILCFQETNFKHKTIHPIKGYQGFAKNRNNSNHASGGVAIYIKNNTITSEIHLQTNIEAVAVNVQLPTKLCVCNIYLPNSYTFETSEINDLLSQLPKPFIILGDFNSHSTLWGSNNTDQRGRKIGTILENPNLNLLNTNQPTHFTISNGSLSSIDLSICNTNIAHRLDWTVLDDLHDSDHFPILIRMGNPPFNSNSHQFIPKWKLNKANWVLYKELITKYLEEAQILDLTNTANTMVKKFSQIIIRAANEAIGLTTAQEGRKLVPWWNDQCKETIKLAKHAFNRYKKHKSVENLINYKRTRAIARRTIKESKRDSWNKFVSTLTKDCNVKEIWNKINTIKGHQKGIPPFIEREDKSYTSNPQEIANILAATFAKNSDSNNYSEIFRQHKENKEKEIIQDTNECPYPYLNDPLSMKELNDAITNSKNSSPGPDNIPAILLKNMDLTGKETLLQIYNKIWTSNCFPKKWNEAIVIPIPKPGKDQSKTCNYRPISLTCNMCKILEKIVNARIRWFLEHHNILADNQFGFRPGHSTISQLISIETSIQEAFANNNHVLAVNLDIEKAYDMTWKHRILTKLRDIGITGNIGRFINNFMHNRSIYVRFNGFLSEKTNIENGVPQGSVLSVTLFLIAINDVCKLIQPPIITRVYADDITLLCKGKNIESTKKCVNSALEILDSFCKHTGFKFSSTKTECILFSKHNEQNKPTINLGNNALKFVNFTKVLGVIFDTKLTWKEHVNTLSDNCRKRINILKSIAYKSQGADKIVILLAYKAIIRSKLDYACVVYNSAKSVILKKLDPIHNTSLRMAVGAFHTTSIGSILIEAREPSLAHRRKYLSLKYATKALSSTNPIISSDVHPKFYSSYALRDHINTFYQRINKYSNEIKYKIPNMEKNRTHKVPPWTLIKPNIDTSLTSNNKKEVSSEAWRSLFKKLTQKYDHFSQIFIDGSKNQYGTGASVITNSKHIKHTLDPINSSKTAETFSLILALQHIRNSNETKFLILSDSLVTINKTQDTNTSSEMNTYVQELYHNLSRSGKKIVIAWIPSHKNIYGNKIADLTAKFATTDKPENQPICNTPADVNKYIQQLLKESWNTAWKTFNISTLHKTIPNFYDLKTNPDFKRSEQIIITRIRSGHTKLTHVHLLENKSPPICDICNTRLTINHIITECPHYNEERRKHGLSDNINNIHTSLPFQRSILNFCNDIKISNRL